MCVRESVCVREMLIVALKNNIRINPIKSPMENQAAVGGAYLFNTKGSILVTN